MKTTINPCKQFTNAAIFVVLIMAISQNLYSQNSSFDDSTNISNPEHNQNIGTSVFVLTSLVPSIDVFYYEIDYGRKINDKSGLMVAVLIQKSFAPMSLGFSGDTTQYPGHVVSGGLAFGYQRFLWKNLFVMPMVNPLIVNYYNKDKKRITSGFMLMLCTRLGYRFDYKLFRKAFYFEVGGELNYWPINTNEPADFLKVEKKFNKFVFAPSLNIGFSF